MYVYTYVPIDRVLAVVTMVTGVGGASPAAAVLHLLLDVV